MKKSPKSSAPNLMIFTLESVRPSLQDFPSVVPITQMVAFFLSLSPSQFSALAFFIVRPRDMEGPGREFANKRGVLGHFSQPIYG